MTCRYHRSIAWFLLFLVLAFPFEWIRYFYHDLTSDRFGLFLAIAISFLVIESLLVCAYVYARTYAITIEGDQLSLGPWFGRKHIRISHWTSVEILDRPGGGIASVRLLERRRRVAKIDRYLKDLPEFLSLLVSEVKAAGGKVKQNEAREKELERQKRNAAAAAEGAAFTPNHIPTGERIGNVIFSVLLLAYGGFGLWTNDLYIPGKRGPGVHLHDGPAWLMFGAMICACAVMLSVVADHYDKRNNETNYRLLARILKFLAWALLFLSMGLAAMTARKT